MDTNSIPKLNGTERQVLDLARAADPLEGVHGTQRRLRVIACARLRELGLMLPDYKLSRDGREYLIEMAGAAE